MTKNTETDSDNDVKVTTIFGGKGGVTEGKWSPIEKTIVVRLYKEEPVLPYPFLLKETRIGTKEMVYDIPKEDVVGCVAKLWPWKSNLETTPGYYSDLHSRKRVDLQDMMILRYENRNIPVCPDYFQTGGMIVDLVETYQLEETAGIGCVTKEAKQN